jgi:hypothetical protein
MGANAQTSVPDFTAGQVLTAAQMTEVNTGVPVFADSTARDAAFGGTGEKTLAEGQYAYLESTNQTLVYDGSNWVSVGVAPGLVLVSSTTIGTAVGSVTVTGAFSATYDNYRILISDGAAPGGNVQLNLTLGATTTGYSFNNLEMSYNAGTITGSNGNATTSWVRVGRGDTNNLDAEIEIKSPFLAKRTTGQWRCSTSQVVSIWSVGGGYLDNATSYTAFTITPSSVTLTGGTIRVYGYANS